MYIQISNEKELKPRFFTPFKLFSMFSSKNYLRSKNIIERKRICKINVNFEKYNNKDTLYISST